MFSWRDLSSMNTYRKDVHHSNTYLALSLQQINTTKSVGFLYEYTFTMWTLYDYFSASSIQVSSCIMASYLTLNSILFLIGCCTCMFSVFLGIYKWDPLLAMLYNLYQHIHTFYIRIYKYIYTHLCVDIYLSQHTYSFFYVNYTYKESASSTTSRFRFWMEQGIIELVN